MDNKVRITLITAVVILVIIITLGLRDVFKTATVATEKNQSELTSDDRRISYQERENAPKIKAKATLSSDELYFPKKDKPDKVDPEAISKVKHAAENSLDPEQVNTPVAIRADSDELRLPEGVDTLDADIYLDAEGNLIISNNPQKKI
ncbi:MAG: hypothetical protein ABIG64_01920 [Candidatus Omnitrophota bacterium]